MEEKIAFYWLFCGKLALALVYSFTMKLKIFKSNGIVAEIRMIGESCFAYDNDLAYLPVADGGNGRCPRVRVANRGEMHF